MVPFAAPNNLRLVLLNRRDYPGSTPLSDDDLRLLSEDSTPEDNALFLRLRALELSEFLAWYIRKEAIPPTRKLNSGGNVGGMSIVAWSSANNLVLALLGNLEAVPQDARNFLEPYLHTYIHFGTSQHVL